MQRLIIVGAVLALIGAACGDDAADTTVTPPTTAATTTTAAETTTTAAPATTVAETTTSTTTTTTVVTTTAAPTTTTAATTTTTTLPPPLDPSIWIGVAYTGMAPEGLELLQTECVGIDYICDYSLSITVIEGSLPPLPPFEGPIDFIALLASLDANNDALIVDAATIRGIGTDLVWSECWTTAGNVYVVGVWDRVTGIIGAFRWDVATEDVWVIQGSEVAVCWDPMDNE